MGRADELLKLEEWVGFSPKKTPQKSIVTLWGLAGVGKSQLASEFVKQQREKHPSYDIFWTVGATKEAFEQSIVGLLETASESGSILPESNEGYDKHRAMLMNSFFSDLKSTMHPRWLLVIDGISGDSSLQQLIRDHLERLPWGSIVLTTRRTEVANWYHRRIEVRGLSESLAVDLLRRDIDERFQAEDNGIYRLLNPPTGWSSRSKKKTGLTDT